MVRMTSAQAGAYIGLVGQIVYDLGSGALRAMDGVTPGGKFTLMGQNNLADLPDKAAARNGLGLGTVATHAFNEFDLAGAAATAQANAIATSEAFATAADVTVLASAHTYTDTQCAAAQTAAVASAKTYADATFLPLAGGTMTGVFTAVDGGTWGTTGIKNAKALGVGFTGAFETMLDLRDNANGGASLARIKNTNAGTGVSMRFRADNGTHVADLIMYGTGFTSFGIHRADGMELSTDGAGGLTVGTISNQPLYFAMNGAERGRFATDGGFQVGTAAAAGLGGLRTGGAIVSESTISAVGDITGNTSDIRLKTDVRRITDALDKVDLLKGVTYDWNDMAKEMGLGSHKGRYAGLIAQDVERVLPEAIRQSPADERYLAYQPEQVIALLVEAVKELKAKVALLEANQ